MAFDIKLIAVALSSHSFIVFRDSLDTESRDPLEISNNEFICGFIAD